MSNTNNKMLNKQMVKSRLFISAVLTVAAFSLGCIQTWATVVSGRVVDAATSEPLIGATIMATPGAHGTVTDADGHYSMDLKEGSYVFTVKYIGYSDYTSKPTSISGDKTTLDFALDSDERQVGEVTVTAEARKSSDVAIALGQQKSLVVQTGIGSDQISRTQDSDASEVIRRVPGISIIDEKFVMVRGLSQRYNNVWMNGGAVPSSEADSRAFSFDIVPSSQIDNLTIIKSPAPEYPADFTGGFILITTKQQPLGRQLRIQLGASANTETHFSDFTASRGSGTDWLGFDSGMRRLDAGMTGQLKTYEGYSTRLDVMKNGLNNNWRTHNLTPVVDPKFNIDYSNRWRRHDGSVISLLAAANYSMTYRTLLDMENSLYGPYDISNQQTVYLRKATDQQWTRNVRIGAMLNLSFRPRDDRHLFEWKNIFNQLGKDRYSTRTGFNAQPDNINDMEYYYSSRSTYNTQFTGRHSFATQKIDWSLGYAYANRDMPDRRLIERTDRTDQTMGIYRISREFTRLDEHIFSANANYQKDFAFGNFAPTLKAGLYGEHRTRKYTAREFQYGWQPENSLPTGFQFYDDVANTVLIDDNYGADKLYLYEEVNLLNNYKGRQTTGAGYLSLNIPFGSRLNAYAGVRYEHVHQVLTMNTRQQEVSWHDTPYDYNDLFPSVNLTYHLADKHQVRMSYGRSVNRPEFRELSTSVFYDFDLGSDVMGNADLKAAYIDNIDLRYEWYPSDGEQISVALFYKHFTHPIEWTYTVAGGTDLVYSYINARGADNYGVEVDIRKRLDFIALPDFSVSLNASLIKSKVRFDAGSNNIDRPMQGQSPYLINMGLFYSPQKSPWSAALLYNRIGKRIIGVGNRYGNAADGSSRNIPDSYEMPRDAIDLTLSRRFGQWELKASARDILAQDYLFKQFEEVTQSDGKTRKIEQVNRRYKPGRTFQLALSYRF